MSTTTNPPRAAARVTLPRCPVPACPIRYTNGNDRICSDHRQDDDRDAKLTETNGLMRGQLAAKIAANATSQHKDDGQ